MSEEPARIPADIDRDDRIVAGLTARQLLLFAAAAFVLYTLWTATRAFVPLGVFAIMAIPFAAATIVFVLGRRDGVSLDRLLVAALRQHLTPRQHIAAPEGIRALPGWAATRTSDQPHPNREGGSAVPLRLPAETVTDAGEAGVIDLGGDGLALVAVCGTVNFALRTPSEQAALVAGFGRWLQSLTGEVQILIRAERLDLSPQIHQLYEAAGGLPHPALEEAAVEHAAFLAQLAENTTLLRRNVLLLLREPAHAPGSITGPGVVAGLLPSRRGGRSDRGTRDQAAVRSAQERLLRRLGEAVELLAPVGITVTALDAGQATAVLATACNPENTLAPAPGMAAAGDVITTAPITDDDSTTSPHSTPTAYDSRTQHTTRGDTARGDTAWHDEPAEDGSGGGDDERVAAFLRRYTP